MDTTKFEGEFTYEKAKESIEAIMLMVLIGHFTGYRPDNDDEIEDLMAYCDDVFNVVVKGILEETDKEELHELMKSQENGMDVFKKELFNLMKMMETV